MPFGAPSIKMCRSKSPLFRYNCRKNCQLASAKLTVFCFILTKNRQILSALQFLLSCFIRISEKKFLAYLPYSRDFLSLRRMKERRKNRHLFIEGAPSGRQLLCKGACRYKNQRKAAESREGICKKYLRISTTSKLVVCTGPIRAAYWLSP